VGCSGLQWVAFETYIDLKETDIDAKDMYMNFKKNIPGHICCCQREVLNVKERYMSVKD